MLLQYSLASQLAAAMRQEFVRYEICVSDDGSDKYGAFSTGARVDLVTAVMLGALYDLRERRITVEPLGRLGQLSQCHLDDNRPVGVSENLGVPGIMASHFPEYLTRSLDT